MLWAKTEGGKAQPFDPEPTPTGNTVIDALGVAHTFGSPEKALDWAWSESDRPEIPDPDTGPILYTAHHATCPERRRFKRTATPRRAIPEPRAQERLL